MRQVLLSQKLGSIETHRLIEHARKDLPLTVTKKGTISDLLIETARTGRVALPARRQRVHSAFISCLANER